MEAERVWWWCCCCCCYCCCVQRERDRGGESEARPPARQHRLHTLHVHHHIIIIHHPHHTTHGLVQLHVRRCIRLSLTYTTRACASTRFPFSRGERCIIQYMQYPHRI